ncbi:MAG: elongation factor Ts [Bacteroidia bacterium]|nr:elongation factor Ts [Bacteroidia bacterium]
MASNNLIELIKVLRERTGAGMMDCKKALEENALDVEKSIDWLREKGIAKAAKKASRIAAEGLTKVRVCDGCGKGIVLEVNCETDFVARGDKFIALVDAIAQETLHNEPADIDAARNLVASLLTDASVALGEKLDYRRFEIVKADKGQGLSSYIHMNGKISVLVLLDKADEELGKGLAMHIAANNPSYIVRTDVPASVIEHEKSIARELAKTDEKLVSKPANILDGIILGKVNKLLAESTLSEQAYLLDGEKTVAEILKAQGNKVLKFVRFQVGEGIEKRSDDFAAEVMSQVK